MIALGTEKTWLVVGTSRGFVMLWDLRFQARARPVLSALSLLLLLLLLLLMPLVLMPLVLLLFNNEERSVACTYIPCVPTPCSSGYSGCICSPFSTFLCPHSLTKQPTHHM